MSKAVVITGIGVVAPNAVGASDFQDAIRQGKSGIVHVEELEKYGFGCQLGGLSDISNADCLPLINKYGLEGASDIIKFAVCAALEAWKDAGLEIPDFQNSEPDYDTGSIIGSGIGSVDVFGERIIPFTNASKIKKLRSTIVEHSMLSGASAALTMILGLGNQTFSNSSACSTGTEAIIMGCERIREGKAKRMIVGASEAFSPYGWAGFDAMRVLTRRFNDKPQEGSRPMSATASGFVPGSGSGILILEEKNSAVNRNAKIYGEIIGTHINSGGQRQGGTMSAPNSNAVIRCIRKAIEQAGIKNKQIDYISGHLSSTMADPIEINNWVNALQLDKKDFPWINSLKSMTGHCIGAAGAIETVAAVIQMSNNFIHPSINCEELHPEIAEIILPEKIPNQMQSEVKINYLAKASFGFGDVNTCVIIKNHNI